MLQRKATIELKVNFETLYPKTAAQNLIKEARGATLSPFLMRIILDRRESSMDLSH